MEQLKANRFYHNIKLEELLALKGDKDHSLLVMNSVAGEVLTRPWPLPVVLEGVLVSFPETSRGEEVAASMLSIHLAPGNPRWWSQ